MFIHTYEHTDNVLDFDRVWHVAAFKQPTKWREVEEMENWCYKTFGPTEFNHLTYEQRWKNDIRFGEVSFKRKQDLEWFVLKWS